MKVWVVIWEDAATTPQCEVFDHWLAANAFAAGKESEGFDVVIEEKQTRSSP